MSDYMYLLDSLVSREQSRLLTEVQNAAAEVSIALYLTGGAMRDMLGGFPIRDLDFTIEGNALKFAKSLAEKSSAKILSTDEVRRSAELLFPGGVTVQIAMARQEKYGKPGAK